MSAGDSSNTGKWEVTTHDGSSLNFHQVNKFAREIQQSKIPISFPLHRARARALAATLPPPDSLLFHRSCSISILARASPGYQIHKVTAPQARRAASTYKVQSQGKTRRANANARSSPPARARAREPRVYEVFSASTRELLERSNHARWKSRHIELALDPKVESHRAVFSGNRFERWPVLVTGERAVAKIAARARAFARADCFLIRVHCALSAGTRSVVKRASCKVKFPGGLGRKLRYDNDAFDKRSSLVPLPPRVPLHATTNGSRPPPSGAKRFPNIHPSSSSSSSFSSSSSSSRFFPAAFCLRCSLPVKSAADSLRYIVGFFLFFPAS